MPLYDRGYHEIPAVCSELTVECYRVYREFYGLQRSP